MNPRAANNNAFRGHQWTAAAVLQETLSGRPSGGLSEATESFYYKESCGFGVVSGCVQTRVWINEDALAGLSAQVLNFLDVQYVSPLDEGAFDTHRFV